MDMDKMIYIKKKTGLLEDWNPQKIVKAVEKSANRASVALSDDEYQQIIDLVWGDVNEYASNIIPVNTIHAFVEKALREVNTEVAESYMEYRNWVKKEAEMNARVWEECQSIQFLGDKSNANADSARFYKAS
jgi:ribonucleoside-triphosphate reductase